jgi:hypothetical protein
MKVLISFVFLLLLNCSKTDPVTGEKILIENTNIKNQNFYIKKLM